MKSFDTVINQMSYNTNKELIGFHDVFDQLMRYEEFQDGQITNNKNDPGGLTKYGISQRYNPTIDVANLTREQAELYYFHNWWMKYNYNLIMDKNIALKALVIAINVDATEANKTLQNAICDCGEPVVVDGNIGKFTLSALNRVNPKWLLDRFRVLSAMNYVRKVEANKNELLYLPGFINRALR